MREKLKDMFLGHKHKWIWFHTDSKNFNYVLQFITEAIQKGEIETSSAKALIKSFKFHEKVFIKYIKSVGRKDLKCLCHLIDSNNKKIEIFLKPEIVLSSIVLNGTPKSLKLYKTNEKSKNNWTKPDDGFIDPISYPPVEEELTELGYAMYKDWTEEVAASGMTSTEYYRKLCGISKYYKKS